MAHTLHKRIHRAAAREALTRGPTWVLFLLQENGDDAHEHHRSDLAPRVL